METADQNRSLRIHSIVEHFKDIETVLGRNLTGGARFAADARKREVRAEYFARLKGVYAPFAHGHREHRTVRVVVADFGRRVHHGEGVFRRSGHDGEFQNIRAGFLFEQKAADQFALNSWSLIITFTPFL